MEASVFKVPPTIAKACNLEESEGSLRDKEIRELKEENRRLKALIGPYSDLTHSQMELLGVG